jgi:hypothetical protein
MFKVITLSCILCHAASVSQQVSSVTSSVSIVSLAPTATAASAEPSKGPLSGLIDMSETEESDLLDQIFGLAKYARGDTSNVQDESETKDNEQQQNNNDGGKKQAKQTGKAHNLNYVLSAFASLTVTVTSVAWGGYW